MILRRKFYLASTGFLLLFALLLTGCATTNQTNDPTLSNPAGLKTQSILKFSDVPVPVGLKSLPLDSYSFESSGVRVGVLKYRGKGNPDLIINFYKEQMPLYNWNLINLVEYGQKLINFEREGESCIITLEPKGSSVTLTISLGPKSQITTRKAKQVIR